MKYPGWLTLVVTFFRAAALGILVVGYLFGLIM
jgi:hypothetical protein